MVDEVVVVVTATHWLATQLLPGSQVPHSCGMPQPLSIEPHCAESAAQSCGEQQ
ncbi:MAG TPA: hypothetical protein VN634_22025 [Candidatus Limnocylindrales bacterium]|nr:hypothetical protein [Candidatus Limnocylindrales bacterium]